MSSGRVGNHSVSTGKWRMPLDSNKKVTNVIEIDMFVHHATIYFYLIEKNNLLGEFFHDRDNEFWNVYD